MCAIDRKDRRMYFHSRLSERGVWAIGLQAEELHKTDIIAWLGRDIQLGSTS